MNLLIMIALIQTPQPKDFIASPHHGATLQQPAVENLAPNQIIPSSRSNTTPHLSEDTEIGLTHAQMERDIGGQNEAIGELKTKIGTLEEKRERIDRPDIDGLKDDRKHAIWTLSLLGTVAGTLIVFLVFLYKQFGKVVWEDIAKKRLRAFISGLLTN